MTMTPVLETHIYKDEQGQACVRYPRIKVRMVVESVKQYGSPEAVVRDFPHLTLADIHAAMAYYYDHQAEMDVAMRRLQEFADDLKKATPELPATKRVREAMEGR